MKKTVKHILIGVTLASAVVGLGLGYYTYRTHKSAAEKQEIEKSAAGNPLLQDLLSQRIKKYKKTPIKVACIGDSITYGSGVLATRGKNSYPAKLGKLLGDDYKVFNYGLSGRTLLNDGRQPYRKEKYFETSQKIVPDIVLIMLGTNDSKPFNWNAEAYEAELQDFVMLYKKLPNHPQVYLMTCCAAFCVDGKDKVAFEVDQEVVENEIVNIIRQTGEACDVPVIDIYEVTKDYPEYFVDGVHPNAEGNQVIAQTIYFTLKNHRMDIYEEDSFEFSESIIN